MSGSRLKVFAVAITTLMTAIALGAIIPSPSLADSTETITTKLYPGWNLIGWVGAHTPVEQVFEELPPQVASIHDGLGRSASRESVRARDGLTKLETGRGYWVELDSAVPVDWSRIAIDGGRRFDLHAGLHLVAWNGRHEVSGSEALLGLKAQLRVAWRWDAAVQEFRPWASSLPGSITGPFRLGRGDGLLIHLDAPVQWLQPAGKLPRVVIDVLPEAEIIETVKSDVRAVEAHLAARFAFELDQSRVTIRLVEDQPETAAATDPCCPVPRAWVSRQPDPTGAPRYEIVMPLSEWTDRLGTTADTGLGEGFRTLLHEYFHILQYELAGDSVDQVPQWIVEGTAMYVERDLGFVTERRFSTHLWTNQLDLSQIRYPYPQGHWLGDGHLIELIEDSEPDSYLDFWRLIDQNLNLDRAWRVAFSEAFDMDPDEFIAQTNAERRQSFIDLHGIVNRAEVTDEGELTVLAEARLPWSRRFLAGVVLDSERYRLTLPREFPYRLRVGVFETGCGAYLDANGDLVAETAASEFAAPGTSEIGPEVEVPAGFCEEKISVQFEGSGTAKLPDLYIKACAVTGTLCVDMFEVSPNVFEALVPLPGSYVLDIRESERACPTYLADMGFTTNRDRAASFESKVGGFPSSVTISSRSEFCTLTIRGKFIGRSADWLRGKTVRAYQEQGGRPYKTEIDENGEFVLPVDEPGTYELALLTSRLYENRMVGCSIHSQDASQWQDRQSTPALTKDGYVNVEEGYGADIVWQIHPHACRYFVSVELVNPSGAPVPDVRVSWCPKGGGLCPDAKTDNHGWFVALADTVETVVFRVRHRQDDGSACDWAVTQQTQTEFTIQANDDNVLVWMLPEHHCTDPSAASTIAP